MLTTKERTRNTFKFRYFRYSTLCENVRLSYIPRSQGTNTRFSKEDMKERWRRKWSRRVGSLGTDTLDVTMWRLGVTPIVTKQKMCDTWIIIYYLNMVNGKKICYNYGQIPLFALILSDIEWPIPNIWIVQKSYDFVYQCKFGQNKSIFLQETQFQT